MNRSRTSVIAIAGLISSLCACDTMEVRQQERLAAFESMPVSTRALVLHRQIAEGMDTNAIYIAWGQPSEVQTEDTPTGPRLVWIYDATRVVHQPYWTYVPSGYGSWSLANQSTHHSQQYVKAKVVFARDQVVEWSLH